MKKAMSWIIPIAVGLALAIIIRMFWLVPVGVSGASMEPNLKKWSTDCSRQNVAN